MKYYLWGLGAVGSSFLEKLKENGFFNADLFYCIDCSEEARKKFESCGGFKNHFILCTIDQNNYLTFLNKLNDGDYLLDFSTNIKNLDILTYCLKNNIHYLFTADSSWKNDLLWTSIHQHYLEYVLIKDKISHQQNTCVVGFGMNPGLVSCFAKMCLKEIVEKDDGTYISKRRKQLKDLLNKNKYGLVAKKLGVSDIQEVDNDTTMTKISFENDTCYSTWNVFSYYYETVSSPEIAFGNKKRFYGYKNIFDCDPKDLFLSLSKSAFEYPVESFSPQGTVSGHISAHEEIYTLRRFFTYKKFKPTVHFLYSPCEYAINSIKNFKLKKPDKLHLINKKEITGGGESVGIIIQGKKFKTRYFGNLLNTNENKESATILQVSASAYAAYIYMLNHPNEGMLFPEEMDENELLKTAKQYLKDYISVECSKIKINLGKGENTCIYM